MRLRAGGLLLALLIVLSGAVAFGLSSIATVDACVPTNGCGTSDPGGVTVNTSGSLAYNQTTATYTNGSPPPANSNTTGTAAQCSGTEDLYYDLNIEDINLSYVKVSPGGGGFEDIPVGGIVLYGGGVDGDQNYDQPEYGNGNYPGFPTAIDPTRNYYVEWDAGTWTQTTTTTKTLVITSYYPSTETITRGQTTVQAGYPTASSKTTKAYAVYDPSGGISNKTTALAHGDYVWIIAINGKKETVSKYIPQWTTETKTVVTGCKLEGTPKVVGFGYETYCTTSSCLAPYIKAQIPASDIATLVDQLEATWNPGTVSSSPPKNYITVWVPQNFELSGDNLPPPTVTQPPVTVSLPGGRSLSVQLVLDFTESVTWTYQAYGGQSGSAPGATCTFTSTSDNTANGMAVNTCTGGETFSNGTTQGADNQLQPAPNGQSGYVFTHDATNLTVTAKITIGISAFAEWTIPGQAEQTVQIILGGDGSTVILTPTPEQSDIKQAEGN